MNTKKLEKLIVDSLDDFYNRRMNRLETLNLDEFLKRKNPYLFRAIGTEKASEIVESILSAYISSSDETIFGDAFFESIARIVSGGTPASARGVDFTIETDKKIMVVAVKSGPNPYNASQIQRQNDEFMDIQRRLYKIHKKFDPILGHSYGKKDSGPTRKKRYRDISGQKFWTEITGDSDFYLKLIRLMKDAPQKHKPTYQKAWDNAVNKFTKEFIDKYCLEDGSIDWNKLTRLVSEDKQQKNAKLPV